MFVDPDVIQSFSIFSHNTAGNVWCSRLSGSDQWGEDQPLHMPLLHIHPSSLCLPLFTYPAARANILSQIHTLWTQHILSQPILLMFHSLVSQAIHTAVSHSSGWDILRRLSASVHCKPTQSTWNSEKAGFSMHCSYYLLLQSSPSCREHFFVSGLDLLSNRSFSFCGGGPCVGEVLLFVFSKTTK